MEDLSPVVQVVLGLITGTVIFFVLAGMVVFIADRKKNKGR